MSEQKKGNDREILLMNVRLSYVYIYKPYEGDKGQKTFCAHLILDPADPQVAAFKSLQREVAVSFWKDKADEVLAQLAAQDRLALHRGDVNKPGVDAYKGMLYISSNSKVQPRIIDGQRNAIAEGSPIAPYSGCRANVIVSVWPQSNQFGKRINAQLMGVQFREHGERLSGGGKIAAADEFPVQAGDADSAAPAPVDAQAGAGLY